MFNLNSLSAHFVTDFLFSLKDVNTVHYTAPVPNASQNMTFFFS